MLSYLVVSEEGDDLGTYTYPAPTCRPGDVVPIGEEEDVVVLAVREAQNGDGRTVLVVRPWGSA